MSEEGKRIPYPLALSEFICIVNNNVIQIESENSVCWLHNLIKVKHFLLFKLKPDSDKVHWIRCGKIERYQHISISSNEAPYQCKTDIENDR